MLRRLRILPLLILVAAAMFTLKLGTIWQDIVGLNASIKSRPALAAEENPSATGTPSETPPGDQAGAGVPADAGAPAAPTAAPAVGDEAFDPRELSQSEIRLLQALADRRKALEAREYNLSQREALLKAAEQRVLDKQANFVAIREEVKGLLDQLDEQETKRIKALVKLYENMKPKDAARILNELELPVLMRVVQRMNVRRLAPVLASMEADKARAITRVLAQREKKQTDAMSRAKDSIAERN